MAFLDSKSVPMSGNWHTQPFSGFSAWIGLSRWLISFLPAFLFPYFNLWMLIQTFCFWGEMQRLPMLVHGLWCWFLDMTQPLPPVLQIRINSASAKAQSASAVKHPYVSTEIFPSPSSWIYSLVLSSQHLCVFPVVPRTCLVLYVYNRNPLITDGNTGFMLLYH